MVPAMRLPAGAGVAPRILSAMALGVVAALWPAVVPAAPGSDAGGSGTVGSGSGGSGAGGDVLTVTGVRATAGDAVECPRLVDDAGRLHPVSWLPPQVAIGDRVTVRGRLAITTGCRGVVLVVETLVGKSDGGVGGGSGGDSGED